MSQTSGAIRYSNIAPEAGMRILAYAGEHGSATLSPYANCLVPLLNALGWRGNARHVAEALPHFSNDLDLSGLIAVLANLNYLTTEIRLRQRDIEPGMLPCLFVPDKGAARVILELEKDGFRVYDGEACAVILCNDGKLRGTAFVIRRAANADAVAGSAPQSWTTGILRRFGASLSLGLVVSAVCSLIGLVAPLLIMFIYDRVIGSGAAFQLYYLVPAIVAVFAFEIAFQNLRARMTGHVAGRLEYLIGCATFRRILNLPPVQTETAPIGAQLARLKEFELVREFFTGPLSEAMLDLPFVVLFILLIAIIGGPLAFIPVGVALIFVVLHLVFSPIMASHVAEASQVKSLQQQFLVETASHLGEIKTQSAESLWLDRYRDVSARVALHDFRFAMSGQTLQIVAHMLMMVAGVAFISGSMLYVISGHLTGGGLLAVTTLGWRALAPLQSGLVALGRWQYVRQALLRIDLLMRLKPERSEVAPPPPERSFAGRLTFLNVSHRFRPDGEPALQPFTLDIPAGQIVAVTGPNGSGKSTFVKLAAGLYAPSGGVVLIDGLDLRQVDAIDLRQHFGMVPQVSHFFYGTIAQNMRLALPTATDEAIRAAARDANVHDDIMALPENYDTRLTEHVLAELPEGFKQKLSLARAYVREAPILILDEPVQALDDDDDRALITALGKLRGTTTILLVTHRPSHMRLADRLVVLDAGRVLYSGAPAEYLQRQTGKAA